MEDAKLEALHNSLQDMEQQRGRRGGLGIGVFNGFRFSVPNRARNTGGSKKRKREEKAAFMSSSVVEKKKKMKEALYSRFVPAGTKVKGVGPKRTVFGKDGVARQEEVLEQQEPDEEEEDKVDTTEYGIIQFKKKQPAAGAAAPQPFPGWRNLCARILRRAPNQTVRTAKLKKRALQLVSAKFEAPVCPKTNVPLTNAQMLTKMESQLRKSPRIKYDAKHKTVTLIASKRVKKKGTKTAQDTKETKKNNKEVVNKKSGKNKNTNKKSGKTKKSECKGSKKSVKTKKGECKGNKKSAKSKKNKCKRNKRSDKTKQHAKQKVNQKNNVYKNKKKRVKTKKIRKNN